MNSIEQLKYRVIHFHLYSMETEYKVSCWCKKSCQTRSSGQFVNFNWRILFNCWLKLCVQSLQVSSVGRVGCCLDSTSWSWNEMVRLGLTAKLSWYVGQIFVHILTEATQTHIQQWCNYVNNRCANQKTCDTRVWVHHRALLVIQILVHYIIRVCCTTKWLFMCFL